jgi:hypothetical protein
MARIIHSESAPMPLIVQINPTNDAVVTSRELQIVDIHKTEKWDEYTFQYPNGELKTHRIWSDPRTNKQRLETQQTLDILNSMPSLESATHSSKERAHRRQKTRALGNWIRGETKRNWSKDS